MDDQLLSGWLSQDQWYEQSGKSLFRTRSRWDWFFRTHKRELAQRNVIGILGRCVLVHAGRIGPVLDVLIREDAQRRIGAADCRTGE